MVKGQIQLLSSFRARMVIFTTLLLLFATTALYYVNQRLEKRLFNQEEEQTQALTKAIDVAQQSLPSDQHLYDLVNQGGPSSLAVTSQSIIRHILVTDEQGKIIDSTDRREIDQQLQAAIGDIPLMQHGDLMRDAEGNDDDQLRTVKYTLETTKAKRHIVIVVSTGKLKRVVRETARDRLAATIALGLLLILISAIVSGRFTRPITVLARAARRVTAGEVDFQVPVAQRDEFGTLAETFNEMLAGLRSKRELEEKLQRAERSAVVGRLASGIAHEIRNPLNFINLSIDYLREKFAPTPPAPDSARAEYTRILVTIKDEIARLNRMVSDFLSYGRPARLKLRELDARALIAEVAELVNTQAEQQGVQVRIQEAPDEARTPHPHRLLADAEQLKTCFSNLVINAIQAMPEGGQLTITLHPRQSEIEIVFADTGPGIAPEALGQIFEPYYSTKETGIGLGLPLTKKILEDHGGQITVSSEVHVGTTFTVTLPREPMSAASKPLEPSVLSAS